MAGNLVPSIPTRSPPPLSSPPEPGCLDFDVVAVDLRDISPFPPDSLGAAEVRDGYGGLRYRSLSRAERDPTEVTSQFVVAVAKHGGLNARQGPLRRSVPTVLVSIDRWWPDQEGPSQFVPPWIRLEITLQVVRPGAGPTAVRHLTEVVATAWNFGNAHEQVLEQMGKQILLWFAQEEVKIALTSPVGADELHPLPWDLAVGRVDGEDVAGMILTENEEALCLDLGGSARRIPRSGWRLDTALRVQDFGASPALWDVRRRSNWAWRVIGKGPEGRALPSSATVTLAAADPGTGPAESIEIALVPRLPGATGCDLAPPTRRATTLAWVSSGSDRAFGALRGIDTTGVCLLTAMGPRLFPTGEWTLGSRELIQDDESRAWVALLLPGDRIVRDGIVSRPAESGGVWVIRSPQGGSQTFTDEDVVS